MKIKIFKGSDGKYHVKEKGWIFWKWVPIIFASEENVKRFYEFRKEKAIIEKEADKAKKQLVNVLQW